MLRKGNEWVVYDTPLQLEEISTPSTPPSNIIRFYAKDKSGTSALYYKNDAGTEREIGNVFGSGTADRLAYWSAADTLAAVGAITQGHVLFADSNGLPTGESALFWDATNDRLGIGPTDPNSAIEIRGSTTPLTSLRLTSTGTPGAIGGPAVVLHFASAPSAADQNLFSLVGGARISGTDRNAVAIQAASAEAWTAGSAQGAYLTFSTTPTGSATRTERMRIAADGKVGIGTTPNEQLEITGNLRLPATTATAGQIKSATNLLLHTFGGLGTGNSTFLGAGAGNLTMTGDFHTGIGRSSLDALTSGNSNTCIGYQAGTAITTGSSNVGIGVNALEGLTTGARNIAIGQQAMRSPTGAIDTVAIGHSALNLLSTGTDAVAIGSGALVSLQTGNFNTAVGSRALNTLVSESFCTALGRDSLRLATGLGNTGIGYAAGDSLTSGTKNTFLGISTDASSATLVNSSAIGADAVVGQSNHMMLGSSAVTVGIAGAARPTTGSGGLVFPDGTALATMATNTAGLYANDVGGNVEMHVINEDGTVIRLGQVNSYTQTFATADRTFSAYTSDPESSAYTGIDNAQSGSVYATVADLNQLRVAYETLRAHAEDSAQMINALVDDLQTVGLIG